MGIGLTPELGALDPNEELGSLKPNEELGSFNGSLGPNEWKHPVLAFFTVKAAGRRLFLAPCPSTRTTTSS